MHSAGRLVVRRIRRPIREHAHLLVRALRTPATNLAVLWGCRRELRTADEVRLSASPAYMLHFVMPVAKALGFRTRYRITDFTAPRRAVPRRRLRFGARERQRYPTCQEFTY